MNELINVFLKDKEQGMYLTEWEKDGNKGGNCNLFWCWVNNRAVSLKALTFFIYSYNRMC